MFASEIVFCVVTECRENFLINYLYKTPSARSKMETEDLTIAVMWDLDVSICLIVSVVFLSIDEACVLHQC